VKYELQSRFSKEKLKKSIKGFLDDTALFFGVTPDEEKSYKESLQTKAQYYKITTHRF
jgi:hypothetical protein